MNKYTVVIPTTNNLVGITDIIVEDPLISSVICDNNSLEALPISNQYNSFVKSMARIDLFSGLALSTSGHVLWPLEFLSDVGFCVCRL